jgi:hypothetical protein
MDRSSGAGQVNPAALAATVRSVITNRQTELKPAEASAAALPSAESRHVDYTVADLFGRCFLRVCYWVDVFASMTRRGEPLPYVPFVHPPLRSLPAVEPAQRLVEVDSTAQATATPPLGNA